MSYSDIIDILNILDNFSYFDISMPCTARGVMGFGPSNAQIGCKILTCDNHRLDISGDDFYWDNIKYEGVKNEVKLNYAESAPNSQAIAGDNNGITIGNNNQKNNSFLMELFWDKGTIGGIILFGVVWVLKKIIYDKWKEKHKKESNSKDNTSQT